MLSDNIKEILDTQIEKKGRKNVCRELAISPATLSQVLNDKYAAETTAIEEVIVKAYGQGGEIECPVLGTITIERCTDTFHRAMKIKSAGNPTTIRLYASCRRCQR